MFKLCSHNLIIIKFYPLHADNMIQILNVTVDMGLISGRHANENLSDY